jgi:hypothetical protein
MEGATEHFARVRFQSVMAQDLAYRELGFDIDYLHE